ncbi:histidine kinase [Vallitalea okinawensis]|uniref:hypothetical protein n=1 Tax=Vallitalea okinawensis TaxID=2078660 RepID=UPI000CFB5EEA|nr:hypothetical protein [Vallitalea okinawensis]
MMKGTKKSFLFISQAATVLGIISIIFFLKRIEKPLVKAVNKEITHKVGDCIGKIYKVLRKEGEKIEEDEKMQDFLINIPYELKSSLGIIRGYTESLKHNIVNSEEKKKQYYDVLIEEADKMEHLVKMISKII